MAMLRSFVVQLPRVHPASSALPSTLLRVIAVALLWLTAACGSEPDRAPLVVDGTPSPPDVLDPCRFAQEGCECAEEGSAADCGTVEARDGDDVVCLNGERRCTDGRWGACEASSRSLIYAPLDAGGLRVQALAGSAAGCGNVCAPECQTYADTPGGVTPGTGLTATPDGLSLTPTGGLGGGNCMNVVVAPSTATITVTSFSPLVTSPATLAFTATCGPSGPSIQPTWSLGPGDLDTTAIGRTTGVLTVYAGIAKDVTVTALTALGSATATAQVRVNVDAGSACAGAYTTQLNGAAAAGDGGNVDPAQLLYPYAVAARPVVFPQSLPAPLLQWSTGGRSASCTKVTLRYPATSPIFKWQRMFTNDPAQGGITAGQPSVLLDQTAWYNFGRTAEGQAAQIVVQRRTDGTVNAANPANKVMSEEITPVRFANDALRGTVYYTQYLSQFRDATNSGTAVCAGQNDIDLPSYPGTSAATGALTGTGPICPVGNCTHPNASATTPTSMTRAIDLSSTSAPNKDPFVGTAGCPVCHSVSSNGTTYVSGSAEWQESLQPVGPFNPPSPFTSDGIDRIGTSGAGDPLFTPLGPAPYYTFRQPNGYPELGAENSRGFSYAAITPDGSRVLQGANFWGNTGVTPAPNNLQDGTVRGVTNKVKPYFIVKTALPGFGVQFATTTALPAYTTSGSNVLNRNGGSATLTIDSVGMALEHTVLVAGESAGNAKNNGVYIVTGANPWQLTRRSDADAVNDIKPGTEVRVTDGNTQYGEVYYVSAPASGAITPGTTSITFTERVMPSLPSMMVPVFSPDGTKVAYVNADKDTIVSTTDTGWRRGLSMFSFDQSKLDTAQAATAVSSRKRLLNNWSSGSTGTPVKWPFFEPDSRSLVYVETDPNEYCASNALVPTSDDGRACSEAAYGSMSPTTRARWAGKLYSLDTAAGTPSSTRRELAYVNKNNGTGMDPSDFNQAYQPTVLPFVSGGYRWVIFTSQRAYGNQFNVVGTNFTCASALLWMAAIDDQTATSGTARDYPAFLVPGQKIRAINNTAVNSSPDGNGEIGGQHYVNERGYLVPSPCKPTGTGAAAACTVSEECCGGSGSSPTTACRIDLPATSPVTRHCTTISGACSMANGSCSNDLDCCGNAPGSIVNPCLGGQCTAPPTYTTATFVRDYNVACPATGYKVVWGDFRWHARAASTSTIGFSVQTSATASFVGAPSVPLATATSANINQPPAAALAINVDTALEAASVASGHYLRVSMAFNPSTMGGAITPILYDWEQRYACVPAE